VDTETAPDLDPLLGETIAGYRITSLIGEGGMGRVYRAVLPSINAQVAIKVLSASVAGEPDIAERFIAEAKIANLVRHDGLVNVIGLGVVPDGRPYQIMELLHGATLAELIRERGKLPLGTAIVALVSLVAPLLRGLTGRPLGEPRLVTLASPVPGRGDFTHLVLVRVDPSGAAHPVGHAGSAMLRGLAQADGFAVIDPGTDGQAGASVPLVPLPQGGRA